MGDIDAKLALHHLGEAFHVPLFRVLFSGFFFSSRRRHTRCLSDWSSDVCSSDLQGAPGLEENLAALAQSSRSAWPKINVPAEEFVRRVAEGMPDTDDPITDLNATHGDRKSVV